MGDHDGLPEKGAAGDGEASIGHADGRVGRQRASEPVCKLAAFHDLHFGREKHVGHHVDFEVEDDTEQAVTSHGEGEQFTVLGSRAFDDGTIGKHHAQRPHRRAKWPIGNRPSVRIDAIRAADAKIVVGLHHGGREPERVERLDHIGPPRAGVHQIGLGRGIGLQHPSTQGDGRAIARQALAAHRMSGYPDDDGTVHCRRLGKFGTQTRNELILLPHPGRPMLGDRRRIETAGVVEDGALFGETGGRTGAARGERQGAADEVAPRRCDVPHDFPPCLADSRRVVKTNAQMQAGYIFRHGFGASRPRPLLKTTIGYSTAYRRLALRSSRNR